MKQVLHFKEFGQIQYENRILYLRINEGLELSVEILEKIFGEAEKLSGGSTYCILADARHNVSATSNARKYAAKNPYSQKHLAYATLADTIAVIMLSNFFIKINQPIVPARLFKKEDEALKWLQSYL